jgi:hypothetical protein
MKLPELPGHARTLEHAPKRVNSSAREFGLDFDVSPCVGCKKMRFYKTLSFRDLWRLCRQHDQQERLADLLETGYSEP